MYIRMVIGEAISEDQVREFRRIYKEEIAPEILKEPGSVSDEIMFEEGGTMVIVSPSGTHERNVFVIIHPEPTGSLWRRPSTFWSDTSL